VQSSLNALEPAGRLRRSNYQMPPMCPVCIKPMKEYDRAFQCDPCRQIIIFFEVSDASRYIPSGGALRGNPQKE
jgi:hypothetical protein